MNWLTSTSRCDFWNKSKTVLSYNIKLAEIYITNEIIFLHFFGDLKND